MLKHISFSCGIVMQFSGQHHGVPGVGMTLPGYVPQSQLGFNNSEMTW